MAARIPHTIPANSDLEKLVFFEEAKCTGAYFLIYRTN